MRKTERNLWKKVSLIFEARSILLILFRDTSDQEETQYTEFTGEGEITFFRGKINNFAPSSSGKTFIRNPRVSIYLRGPDFRETTRHAFKENA